MPETFWVKRLRRRGFGVVRKMIRRTEVSTHSLVHFARTLEAFYRMAAMPRKLRAGHAGAIRRHIIKKSNPPLCVNPPASLQ
jgi:hypothetical protein